MGKGSGRRQGTGYDDNFDRIFKGKTAPVEEPVEDEITRLNRIIIEKDNQLSSLRGEMQRMQHVLWEKI